MSHELLYTSAPRGLKPGSRGFCTVVCTRNLPAALASGLESLSAYRHVFPAGDPSAGRNPVAWSHVKLSSGGKTYSVLSRIGDCGLDYSQRGNKLAHHLVLEPREQPSGGPTWLLAQPGFMTSSWDGNPALLPCGRTPRDGSSAPAKCTAWQSVTGDAGWAGVLAEAFLANPERAAYLVFEPGMDLLPLLHEAVGLLPPERRWEVTFSTYFTGLPPGVVCNWRCVLADSPEAQQMRRFPQALQINLCEPLPAASGGELVELARRGPRPSGSWFAGRRSEDRIGGAAGFHEPALRADEFDALPHSSAASRDPPLSTAESYALQGFPGIPRNMPPPPPTGRRRRLAELDERQRRASGKRRWIIAGSLTFSLVLIGGAVAGWVFRERLLGEAKRVAAADPQTNAALKPVGHDDESPDGTDHNADRNRSAKSKRSSRKATVRDVHDSDPDGENGATAGKSGNESQEKDAHTAGPAAKVAAGDTGENSAEHAAPSGNPATPPSGDTTGPPRKPALIIRYNGRPLKPNPLTGAYFVNPNGNGALEIEAAGTEGLNWRLRAPEGHQSGIRVQSPSAGTSPFWQKLVAPSPEGAGGQITLFTLRRQPIERGEGPEPALIGLYPGAEAGALVDRIRWSALDVETADAGTLLIVLHELLPLPEPRRLEKGKVVWRLDAWGDSVPELVVDSVTVDVPLDDARLPLTFERDGDDESNRPRLVCAGESRALWRKRQEGGQWSDDVSPPEMLASAKFDSKGKKSVEVVLTLAPVSQTLLDKDVMSLNAQLASRFGVNKFKFDADALADDGARELHKRIEEVIKKAQEAGDAGVPDSPLASWQKLQADLGKLEARARSAARAKRRLSGAAVVGARIFYRVEGRNDKIDLIHVEEGHSRSTPRAPD